MKIKIVLENGNVYEGKSFGYFKETICEIVFNTSVTGYTELMTDPSYSGQGVVMASPIIGNYGVFESSFESDKPALSCLIIRNKTLIKNDARNACNLDEFLDKHKIVGVYDVDTRALTLEIREQGTMKGIIIDANADIEIAVKKVREFHFQPQVPIVSSRESTKFLGSSSKYKIALLDYGAKNNILRILNSLGCDVTRYPHDTKAKVILAQGFDGIVLSNGPGDPKDCKEEINQIKKLVKEGIPLLGICLGHQLIARSFGFETVKLKYGHRGINHTVKNISTGKCYVTSQNHSYCVDENTIENDIALVSYINLNDGSVEGLYYPGKNIVSVQFHPEGAPGPMDTKFIFDEFLKTITKYNYECVI